MNLYTLLQERAQNDTPIRIGVIGAGKFSSMFLSQVRLTPGMQVVGIAELDPQKATEACIKTGWPKDSLSVTTSTGEINDAAKKQSVAITEDAVALIAADLDVIIEITGIPESGAVHAYRSLEAGKHVVMVNVEADCLLGPVLHKKAAENNLVYSMAYGDQPALISEQIDWARAVGLEVVCAAREPGTSPNLTTRLRTPYGGTTGFQRNRWPAATIMPRCSTRFWTAPSRLLKCVRWPTVQG